MDPDTASSFLRVQVWGLFLQSAAFGIYMITAGYCFRLFFAARTCQRGVGSAVLNWPMLVIFLIFFAKTTSSVAIHLYFSLQIATVDSHSVVAAQIMDGSNPVNISKYTTILIQATISSGVLIYRCWLAHSRSWVIVALPIVLWLGGVAVMGILIHVDTISKINGLSGISQSRNFAVSFWAIIVAVNIITTALIARLVWRRVHLRRRPSFQPEMDCVSPTMKQSIFTGQSHTTMMKQATHTIIESGLIYTAMSILTFFLFVASSVAFYVVIDVLVQAIGISFNLILIHNHPGAEISSQSSNLNNVPLQVFHSNMSTPGSAIEFAYPKHFMPRRKNPSPPNTASTQQEDRDIGVLGPAGMPQTQRKSHESI
ncbi:hypothetical protein B0H11DRAFT_1960698 [Mycena galericulata]|nr:hypothetical protein B0H11DRAFT_1960698 [Mycena galericulata]